MLSVYGISPERFMAIEAVPLRRSTMLTMGENVSPFVLMKRLEVLIHDFGR
jgi:hypothetical protein